jgi:hypothetical protein
VVVVATAAATVACLAWVAYSGAMVASLECRPWIGNVPKWAAASVPHPVTVVGVAVAMDSLAVKARRVVVEGAVASSFVVAVEPFLAPFLAEDVAALRPVLAFAGTAAFPTVELSVETCRAASFGLAEKKADWWELVERKLALSLWTAGDDHHLAAVHKPHCPVARDASFFVAYPLFAHIPATFAFFFPGRAHSLFVAGYVAEIWISPFVP